MARIPIGNFGNAIPDAAPRFRTPADTGIAAGLGDVAQNLQSVVNEQRKQDLEMQRAKAANAMLDRELAIDSISRDLEEQVSTGKLKYDQVDSLYRERVSALPAHDTGQMDPVTEENFGRGVKRIDGKGEAMVSKIIATGQKIEYRGQADGIIDKLGKQASLPDANPSLLNASIDGMDEIGTRAYGAEWQKKKQDAKDANWSNHLDQQAMVVRNSLEGIADMQQRLTEGDLADKLDSNKRNAIMARLEGYKTSIFQRQEAAAARADREQERRLKMAEHEYNVFVTMSDKGTILDPNYVDRVAKLTEGTPYQAAVRQIAAQTRETGGLAFQPVSKQQEMLDQIDAEIARNGRSPELDKRREAHAKVLDGSKSDLNRDGLRAGLERGVIRTLSPIDVSTPEAFAATVSNRLKEAQTVAQWANQPVSPLDSREAETMRQMLEILPPKQRSAAVSRISEAIGPQMSGALAEQLDKQNRPLSLAFAMSDTKTSAGRYASELLLKGATAIKDGAVMKDDKKVTGWRSTISTELDGVFRNEKMSAAAKDAAYYIVAGIAAEEGGTASGGDIKRAVQMAIGGNIIEHNGVRIPTNGDMSEDDFASRLKSVPVESISAQTDGKVLVGGVEVPAEEFHKAIPGQELMYAGPGKYAVIVRGRAVTNTKGRPIIVTVR